MNSREVMEGRRILAVESIFDVSVVICVRNGAATIRRQLDALDRQVNHPAFEVLVVDNGSSDNTRAIVDAWIRDSEHAAESVRLIDGPREAGIPRTRNTGARHAKGRVLAYCDADDEVDPAWVGAMARAVRSNHLVGGKILARTVEGHSRPEVFDTPLSETGYLPHVRGCNWAVARNTYFAVGGFDESLPRYGFDDVDFSWRVQEAGFPLTYEADAIVHFTVSDGRASIKKRLNLGRGRVLMAARYPRYDPHRYTVFGTLRDVFVELARLARDRVRSRQLDRSRLGLIVAFMGRVIGAIQYRGGRRIPDRQLLQPPTD